MQTQTQSRELKELYNTWCDCHSKGYKKDIKHIYRVGEQPVQTYGRKPVQGRSKRAITGLAGFPVLPVLWKFALQVQE
ncbi:hypothetical protein SAMN05216417_10961 [Nitrosospira multiformis]|uniref:Uncharacterized protein n=1 Tax=Nitrosospira multiformis TaxID=1231 RepID=A0A1I7HH04_9PROT|nr:hypothetical protein SAMN05216417_10961 [Nitrosospira multiformis]